MFGFLFFFFFFLKYKFIIFFFFFFQAEDGIRDATVTGVQTCALPICHRASKGVGVPPASSLQASPVPLKRACCSWIEKRRRCRWRSLWQSTHTTSHFTSSFRSSAWLLCPSRPSACFIRLLVPVASLVVGSR